jgi:uncharacterized SAM-binding protein YcdF (DUF218 family)
MKKLFYSMLLSLLAAGTLWLLGFLWFLGQLPSPYNGTDFRHTDAIIVLTGGGGRIEQGLSRLEQGTSDWLFITGVNEASPSAAVFADDYQKNASYTRFRKNIVLGRKARDTLGNAEEAREWMEQKNFDSLRLVTASYHMPRSLLVFGQALQDYTIVPDPVFPAHFSERWWTSFAGTRLILSEYHKFMATLFIYMASEA